MMNIREDLNNSDVASADDAALAAMAQKGEIEAEETLMRRYGGLVRKKANAYFMAGGEQDDVIQEGMIGLLKAIRKFNPDKKASFGAFADICITTQIITAIRMADRNKHKALNTSVSLSGPAGEGDSDVTLEETIRASTADSPEELTVIKDVTGYILHNGDSIFSEFEMEVLNLFIKGYTYRDIAGMLDKSPKSIDNALQRCKKKVNDYLWK